MGYSEDLLFQEQTLKSFRFSDIDLRRADYIISFIDTADAGTDYFSMPIGAVLGKDIYVFDVVHNQELLGKNELLASDKLIRWNVQFCVIETNKEGSYFIGNMRNRNKNTKFLSIFNTGKKERRIIMQADYILDRFHFLEKSEQKKEYKQFLADLTNYSTKEKNDHDDAPDALSGLAKFCRNYLGLS